MPYHIFTSDVHFKYSYQIFTSDFRIRYSYQVFAQNILIRYSYQIQGMLLPDTAPEWQGAKGDAESCPSPVE